MFNPGMNAFEMAKKCLCEIGRQGEEYFRRKISDPPSRSCFKEYPVSTREFFNKWLGEPCYPLQQKGIDNLLGRNPLKWNIRYNEGILFWGKGGGKDRTIAKLLAYVIYWCMCLKNPQKFFEKQGKDSQIAFGNVSINRDQAAQVFFREFKAILRNIVDPRTKNNWFEDHGVNLSESRGHIHKRDIEFPGNLVAYSLDSREYTGEGYNLLVVIFDEMGGFRPEDAFPLYGALKDTQTSRFPLTHKRALLSFQRSPTDPMSIRYEEAKTEPRTYRMRASTWEVNAARKKEDFSEEFLKNPEQAERVFMCKARVGERGFFRYPQVIAGGINRQRPNPIIAGSSRIFDLMKLKIDGLRPDFIGNPNLQYFGHCDLGTGSIKKKRGGKESFSPSNERDCAGFCLGHIVKTKVRAFRSVGGESKSIIEGVDLSRFNGKEMYGVYIDIFFQLTVKEGEIFFPSIIDFIDYLQRIRGFYIKKFTYDGWQCVFSDTYIPLLSGRKIKIKDLVGNYEGKYVYSYDIKTGKVVPGRVIGAKKTGRKRILKITLDNGKFIKCSCGHPFLMRNGRYKRARDLKVGDSLMPLCRRFWKGKIKGYTEVYHPESRYYEMVHSIVAREVLQGRKKNEVVHHKNFVKCNNNPDNLCVMDRKSHIGLHGKNVRKLWKIPYYRRLFMDGIRKVSKWRSNNREYKDKVREIIKRVWQGRSIEERKKLSQRIAKSVKKLWDDPNYREKQRKAHLGNPGFWKGKNRSPETCAKISKTKMGVKHGKYKNHKIVSIEMEGMEDVYDIKVEKYNNFALSAGVFVHNSKSDIQRLKAMGINSEVLSVDRDAVAYDTMKGLMYLGLLDYYNNLIFIRECEELEKIERGNKYIVDHPARSVTRRVQEGRISGSKDLTDSCAATCFHCMESAGVEFSFGILNMQPSETDNLLRDRDHRGAEKYYEIVRGREVQKGVDTLKQLRQVPLVRYGEIPAQEFPEVDDVLNLGR